MIVRTIVMMAVMILMGGDEGIADSDDDIDDDEDEVDE